MQTRTFDIAGLVVMTPEVFVDERGYFFESFQNERYRELVIPVDEFVQENISKLNTQALWVSSDIKNSYDSRAKEDPFEKYAGKKIEMISPSDLSAKILDSAIPFYYMKVYMGGTDKIITIINSATG